MDTPTQQTYTFTITEEYEIEEPDISQIEIEDDQPVDNIESEKQQRLLTEPLYSSWLGPGDDRPFFAAANVGIFYQLGASGLAPDVLLSLDVQVSQEMREKRNRTYFVWVFGKPPEVVIEIVSNRKGGEMARKQQGYARIGCWYYAVFDPSGFLKGETLQLFELQTGQYVPRAERWLPEVGLGLTLWEGTYEGLTATWLRWCSQDGTLLPTGAERAAAEVERAAAAAERAEAAQQQAAAAAERAEAAQQRAERLAAQLRALGVDPDDV